MKGLITFTIQLAPLDLVPHAIHLFLEQVDHGLWNENAFFYLNGPHVLQAGPQMIWDEEEEEDLEVVEENRVSKFASLDLEELIFPDYSSDYPHEQWTVGFTGRPGGPDMYINKVDNTKSHGPGGQSQHALAEFGDSCFGIVTEGRENLRKLYAMETYAEDEWQWMMVDPVEIVHATVLTKKSPALETSSTDRNQNSPTSATLTGTAFSKVTQTNTKPDTTPSAAMPPDSLMYQQKMASEGAEHEDAGQAKTKRHARKPPNTHA